HQAEHRRSVAGAARLHPGLDDLPDRSFVVGHFVLRTRLAAGSDVMSAAAAIHTRPASAGSDPRCARGRSLGDTAGALSLGELRKLGFRLWRDFGERCNGTPIS